MHWLRHAGEGCGFFGNREHARMIVADRPVHLLQELDGFEVFAATESIGDPFAGFAGIVEIEHRCDGIDAQAIDMKFIEPVKRICYKEISYLITAEVENLRAPFAMLALPWIGVFV